MPMADWTGHEFAHFSESESGRPKQTIRSVNSKTPGGITAKSPRNATKCQLLRSLRFWRWLSTRRACRLIVGSESDSCAEEFNKQRQGCALVAVYDDRLP